VLRISSPYNPRKTVPTAPGVGTSKKAKRFKKVKSVKTFKRAKKAMMRKAIVNVRVVGAYIA
jgi:hypothetical protein